LLTDTCVIVSNASVARADVAAHHRLPQQARYLVGIDAILGPRVEEAERDVGTAPRQLEGDRAPDAARRARDDGDPPADARRVEERLRLRLRPDLVQQGLDGLVH